MKIAIVAPSPIPFLIGGAEKFLWGLQAAINQLTPHDAELIKVPCRDQEFWPLMEAYERFYRLDLTYFDQVISTKYPAWMIRHPVHDVYMQHPCRGAYDLYPRREKGLRLPRHKALDDLAALLAEPEPGNHRIEPFFETLFSLKDRTDLPPGLFEFPGPLTRAVIHFLDRTALARENIRNYFAISKNVIARDGYFPEGAKVEPVNHPTDIRGLYTRGHHYVFTASRLEDLKRVHLLIDAFKRIKADISFKIAGTGGQAEKLRRMAADDERIEFLGFVSDAELVDYYAGALFVPFIPYDEDYGLITLEAMLSGKAVLTTGDAGGATELVTHGVDGLIAEPRPKSLAAAMTRLIENREETIRMGKAARENARHITWENTVTRILGGTPASDAVDTGALTGRHRPGQRKTVVMVNDYPVHPPVSGGQKRIHHMCRNLAAVSELTLVTFGGSPDGSFRYPIAEGAQEIRIPKNRAQVKAEKQLGRDLQASVNDIAAITGCTLNPDYLHFLEQAVETADLVICAHPYLYRAVREVWSGPLWLDAHNVEADMKALVLPHTRKREEALNRVMEVERACIRDAELVSCVCEADRERLETLYGGLPEVLVVPNGMDFSAAAAADEAERESLRERLGIAMPMAVFVGSNHGPNNQALAALCEIAGQCTDTAFFIVGSVCYCLAERAVPENMRLLGVLSEKEKATVLQAAHVALNPVRQGGGTNLKILEYIAWQLPVLTTPQGIRGLDLEAERHLWVRELSGFPEALRKMTAPEREAEMLRMARSACTHAKNLYDWHAVCEPLLERLAAGHCPMNAKEAAQ